MFLDLYRLLVEPYGMLVRPYGSLAGFYGMFPDSHGMIVGSYDILVGSYGMQEEFLEGMLKDVLREYLNPQGALAYVPQGNPAGFLRS